MKLRGIDFGCVIGASGVQGFFGEGYPYHRYYRLACGRRFCFDGMTFTAKTVTLSPKAGNMPMHIDGMTPKEFRPKCIVVNFRKGYALNAVGLSNSGVAYYLSSGKWQKRRDKFFISFMAVGKTAAERKEEIRQFVNLLLINLPAFRGHVALQINFSCPNVGLHPAELIQEICDALNIASVLGIPLVPKINLLVGAKAAGEISNHQHCDALCVSNTIPWGALPDRINWKELFGSDESPLAAFGGGGLSGAPLLPLVASWMETAKSRITKPIIAGGGILSPDDARYLGARGASALSLGSIAMLRPWRLAATIEEGQRLYS